MVVVVVTGASGYLGLHIINACLAKGLSTRGTVRGKEKADACKALFPSVEFFEADLLQEGTFDKAFQGADYVIHAASPFKIYDVDPQKDLLDPAIKGTQNVLEAAKKSGTVKRVVLTSSMVTVEEEVYTEGRVYNESDWNEEAPGKDISAMGTDGVYGLSKLRAEKLAWKFLEEQKPSFDLVTICPSFILGPPLSALNDESLSVQTVKMLMIGVAAGNSMGVSDVRDVASLHVLSLLNPLAKGRYLVSSREAKTDFELAQILANTGEFPNVPFPTEAFDEPPPRKQFNVDKVINDFSFTFTPIEKTLVDMCKALISLGLVQVE